MDVKEDPFQGQFTDEDIRALGDDTTQPPEATPKPQAGVQSFKQKMGMTMTGEQPDKIILTPDIPSKINEEKEKHAVFAFGRFNPPTVGHEKLIHAVEKKAKEVGGSAHVVASHSQHTSKDPLPQDKKVGYLKKVAATGTHVEGSSKEHPTFLQHAAKLHASGVTHLHMVAGSDRVKEYKKKLSQYNGTHKGALYNFKKIEVHSAGQRDPDAEGTEGMSGTKMRALAREGNHKEFKAGLPKALHPHAKEIADHIRSVKEEHVVEAASIQTRVKRSITMKRYKTKIERARQIARKRLAGKKQLSNRTLKQARMIMRRRLAGQRGGNYAHLTRQDKIAIDKLLDKKRPQIKKIAKKIYNRVKQNELQRFAGVTSGKPAQRTPIPVNASLEMTLKDRLALQEKSIATETPIAILAEVYLRGINDWNDSMNVTKHQHAFNRVNSYVAEGKAYEMDSDLRTKEL